MTGYRVQCCTYNGHLSKSSLPGQPDVSSWLSPTLAHGKQAAGEKSGPADIVAVGFQEMIPLVRHSSPPIPKTYLSGIAADISVQSAQHLALAGFSRAALDLHETELLRAVESHAGGETYTIMAKHTIGGIALLVFTRDSTVTQRVVDVRVATCGFGIAGVMGNKGAVGVRVALGSDSAGGEKAEEKERDESEESFTFVTAHLAAHQGQCARRAADWRSLVERLVFTPEGKSLHFRPGRPRNVFEQLERIHPKAMGGPTMQIYDSSYLFVFGDLNYRIESSDKLSKETIGSSLTSNIPLLLSADQLTREKDAGKTLHHLKEGKIAFQPTYKFKVGTDDYKLSQRIPGWCDRVLYATWAGAEAKGGEVELYESAMAFRGSDHKPVTAVVSLPASDKKSPRISFAAPFRVDEGWRSKRLTGWIADRAVGSVWCFLVLLGAGKDVRLGFVNLLLLTLAGTYREAILSLW